MKALAEARTDQDGAVNVELLKDIRTAFGEDAAIRSADLVEKLIADPERPWAEWNRGRPLTQKQLGRLLKPFGICSETVHPPGLPHGRGYQRVRFEEAWEAYCPLVNTPLNPDPPFQSVQARKCRWNRRARPRAGRGLNALGATRSTR